MFLHERLGKYMQRLVAATRPYNPDTDWLTKSPSELVERGVDLGASPRAIICWGRLAKVWALLMHEREEVLPEDIQELAPYILSHRIWLGPHAASHGLTTDAVIDDIIDAGSRPMRTRDHEELAPLVNLADITEIELVILKRMREMTMGDHRSRSQGSGFDFQGLRDWQAGRQVLAHRLGAVVAEQFLAARHPRVRAAEHGDGHADRRLLAVDPLRRRRRADCGSRGARHRDDRHVGGLLPGSVRARHLRSPASSTWPRCGRAWARATSCTAWTPISTSAGCSTCPQSGIDQHLARRLRAPSGDAAGHLRLPVR